MNAPSIFILKPSFLMTACLEQERHHLTLEIAPNCPHPHYISIDYEQSNVLLATFCYKTNNKKKKNPKNIKDKDEFHFQQYMEHIRRTTCAMVREEKKGKFDSKEIKCLFFEKV
jgi:hypothetical protein